MAEQPTLQPSTVTDARLTRAAEDAAARGLAVEFITPESTGRPTADDFGGAPIVKTIVVQRGDSFVFVLTPLDAQFGWPPLRAHLGVNRLSLPDADTAFEATGYRRGTITPLGATTAWPVVLDKSLTGRTIVLGAGAAGVGARLLADDLVTAYGASVVDLSSGNSA
ncbi:aminoacyl-tRNA deacylase [Leucobacter salsicius]|uniref:aminoacyl-tRNA deacylase n=1 Tax=Leucobacter salsicius TaxID=664638 RepID=UPI00034D5C30|nr:YbaK/EbsC family protein [Leucobacter salsicius]